MFRLNSSGVNLVPILIWYQYPNQYWYQYRYWYRCQFQITRDDALTDSKSGKNISGLGEIWAESFFLIEISLFSKFIEFCSTHPIHFRLKEFRVRSASLTLSSCVSVTRDAAWRGGDAMEGLPAVTGLRFTESIVFTCHLNISGDSELTSNLYEDAKLKVRSDEASNAAEYVA